MKQREFERLARRALLGLPEKIRQKIDNLAICVEKRPSQRQLKKIGLRYDSILLGLYEGVPQITWGRGFGGNLPDKITIFQESIENFVSSSREMKELVRNVVWHEVAHHFGFSERRIKLFEKKRKK